MYVLRMKQIPETDLKEVMLLRVLHGNSFPGAIQFRFANRENARPISKLFAIPVHCSGV